MRPVTDMICTKASPTSPDGRPAVASKTQISITTKAMFEPRMSSLYPSQRLAPQLQYQAVSFASISPTFARWNRDPARVGSAKKYRTGAGRIVR
eukprot:SAG11_NODE_717_length_7606_cov_5.968563_5_plen_94_part_00